MLTTLLVLILAYRRFNIQRQNLAGMGLTHNGKQIAFDELSESTGATRWPLRCQNVKEQLLQTDAVRCSHKPATLPHSVMRCRKSELAARPLAESKLSTRYRHLTYPFTHPAGTTFENFVRQHQVEI